jgi:hypothetical protein
MVEDSRAVRQIKAALSFNKVPWDSILWEPFDLGSKRGQWIIKCYGRPDIVGATTKKLCSEDIPRAAALTNAA